MFYRFVQRCKITRIILRNARETKIVKPAVMIPNICRKKMILMYRLTKLCLLLLYILGYMLFICISANSINFSSALYIWLSNCFKLILQSGSSLTLWCLLSLHMIPFFSTFDKKYVSGFLLLLGQLSRA